MKKPQIKREVAIASVNKLLRQIEVYISSDALSDFGEFGSSVLVSDNRYILIVDARYDFDEVVEYIRSYDD